MVQPFALCGVAASVRLCSVTRMGAALATARRVCGRTVATTRAVRLAWRAAQLSVVATQHTVERAARVAISVPAGVVGDLSQLLSSGRGVWSERGRAQIEVRGLDSAPGLAAAVAEHVDELGGVAWCRVDVVTRRLVVRFDPARIAVQDLVAAVERIETAWSSPSTGRETAGPVAEFPGDQRPVALEAMSLLASVAGLAAASAARLANFPTLPGSTAAAVVLVDYQPRLRRIAEQRFGTAGADVVLAIATAAAHGVTGGVASMVVDSAQRMQSYSAARARRDGFAAREADLCGPQRATSVPTHPHRRPVPLPPGPVEKLSDRAAAGSLLAGGLVAATGNLDAAGLAVLIGAPKAARMAREAFADTLTAGVSRRQTVLRRPAALRRLDRISAVLIDSTVLLSERRLVLDASATVEGWTREHVWSAGQRLLHDDAYLAIPPPAGRRRHRLKLTAHRSTIERGVAQLVLSEAGQPVGELKVGYELDAYADSVVAAARQAGLRIVLTENPSTRELAGLVDLVVKADGGADVVRAHVSTLQAEGQVVAVLSADPHLLAAADVGIGLVSATGAVPWLADVLCGPGLSEVALWMAATAAARTVSERGAALSVGATSLGALLAAVGSGRRGGAVLPINLAAGSGIVSGTLSARRLLSAPGPVPVLHTPWHALEPDEVAHRLSVLPLARGGADDAPESALALLARGAGIPVRGITRLVSNVRAELADPLTPVLATGAAASAVIGSPTDAVLVGGVLAANAVISGTQRLRADTALRSLLEGQRLTARVVDADFGLDYDAVAPDAATRELPAGELSVGTVIEVRPGDVVPADARLLSENGLEVDEASLTGESIAVPKQIHATPGAELGDRACMLFEGTVVLAGTGRAVVVAIGASTEAGRALNLAAASAGPAGMQARLEELTRRGLPITLLGGAGVTALSLLRRQPLRKALASGVSVAVAAVPEGLPLVATVAQLSAARRLSQLGVLVRSPRSVEALGRVDTICFDKTGTLTEGRLQLVRTAGLDGAWDVRAAQSAPILRAAARACPPPGPDHPAPHATDRAVLDVARAVLGDATFAEWAEIADLPFHSERGFSAALGRSGERVRLVVKGAPETLLTRCTHVRDENGKRRLTKAGRRQAEEAVHRLAADGLRVLAVAQRTFDTEVDRWAASGEVDAAELAEDLTLLGFIALTDVARAEAASTVAALQAAGLATVMITGDHPVTAQAIARSLGIRAERIVTGAELVGLDDAARTALVTTTSVFARVSPEQKLRIIAALQKSGRVVAMTGDGANDAAAIRLADIGIGMAAQGSNSARGAADLILTAPDLSLILDCLVEGRAMWRRVRDAVAILLGGNAGEVAFTLAGTALGGRAPLGTRQFLLVNMLTDLLPAMAIALAATSQEDAARRALLTEAPPSLGAPLLRDIGVRGAATAAGALLAWQLGRLTGTRRRADTIALGALVGTQLGQTLVVGGRNPLVIATGLGSAAVLAGIIQTPGVSQFFGCRPLGPLGWAIVVGSATAATALSVAAPKLLGEHTVESDSPLRSSGRPPNGGPPIVDHGDGDPRSDQAPIHPTHDRQEQPGEDVHENIEPGIDRCNAHGEIIIPEKLEGVERRATVRRTRG